MSKVTPILKYFFIYKENYMWAKKVENSNNKIILNLVDKDSCYKIGRIFDESVLDESRLECWSSSDLVWEDKQWGQWHKVYVQIFNNLQIIDKQSQVTQDGKVFNLTCKYDNYKIFTKLDNNNNLNESWKQIPNVLIQLPVHYNVTTGKPIQTMLDSFKLEEYYSKQNKK